MSPFIPVVVIILAVLFLATSLLPVFIENSDVEDAQVQLHK